MTAAAGAGQRPTILFMADAVTLAHLARPCALAQAIDPVRFAVVLACDPRHASFLAPLGFPTLPLASISSQQFLHAAATGKPLYDAATLRGYVRDDLALLQRVQPAAVVGDHRLSLSVSARVARIPYLNIVNAYWSPYTLHRHLPLPELPMNRWLGTRVAQALFKLSWPIASAWHCNPLNRVRREHGLASLGHDWFSVYTDGDRTLYADAPELVPTSGEPAHHSFLGPILWAPKVDLPPWWSELATDRPVIYASMGSSGNPAILDLIFSALADLPVTVVATTAGRAGQTARPANARLVDFAPGDQLAARAALVICNGGSLTVYQSLAAGKPLIGIASHMDQQLSMCHVERAGVGSLIRADEATAASLRTAVLRMLADQPMQARARAMSKALAGHDPAAHLARVLDQVITHGQH